MLTLIEFVSHVIIVWLPFYYWIKIAVLVGCMAPGEKNLSTMLYEQVIKPRLTKAEAVSHVGCCLTVPEVTASRPRGVTDGCPPPLPREFGKRCLGGTLGLSCASALTPRRSCALLEH